MKMRLSILMLVMFVISIAFTSVAQAGTKVVFPDGSYAISDSTSSAIKASASSGARMSSTSGWGGTAASSGSRSAWVTTKFYSLLGVYMCSVKTGVYWAWSNGVITTHTRYTPTLSVGSQFPLTSITMSYTWGSQWAFAWNGNPKGGWYTSIICHLRQTVFKYGELGASTVTHEYKEQANGRYWWRATL